MSGGAGLQGSAGLVLAENVAYLEPEPGVFGAMLEGWKRQQETRFLKDSTIHA